MSETNHEHENSRLQLFHKKIKEFKEKNPEDQTLQGIEIDHLNERDMQGWDRYIHLLQKTLAIIDEPTFHIEVYKGMFQRVLSFISSPDYSAWMNNRIGIVVTHFELMQKDLNEKNAQKEYITSELQRFA